MAVMMTMMTMVNQMVHMGSHELKDNLLTFSLVTKLE